MVTLYTSKTLDTLDITSKYWKFATSGLYTEISPRGANLGYGQKRGGPGGSSVVSCEVLHSRGASAPPPLKYGPEHGRLGDVSQ